MTVKKHRTELVILTAVMIGVTVFVFFAALTALRTDQMPFGIQRLPVGTYPLEMAVSLFILGAVMTAADMSCMRLLARPQETARNLCNSLCFAAWLIALGVFICGLSTKSITAAYFLIITLPPMLTWFLTSPDTSVQGDAW